MRSPLLSLFVSSVSALLCGGLLACSSPSDDDAGGLGDSEEELVGSSNQGYFIVTRRDMRRCMAPLCGGFFVKRVNDDQTKCADGVMRDECYVESIQLKGVGLSAREEAEVRASVESGRALIKARSYKKRWNGTVLGTLKASEAWVGATGSTIDGTFYRATDSGIRCITTPCASTNVAELNGTDEHDVIDVRLDATDSPADQETLDRVREAIATNVGLMIAGGVALPKCIPNSNCGPIAIATEFFFKVARREGRTCGTRAGDACNAGQYCKWAESAQCGAADVPGKCAYKPEFCAEIYAPVCGCDGKTYGNACEAGVAGVSVVAQGECAN